MSTSRLFALFQAPGEDDDMTMADPSRVRPATAADEPALMDLCRQLHAENAVLRLNEDRVRAAIRAAVQPPNYQNIPNTIGVIGKPNAPLEGAIYLLASQDWYTDEWCLTEIFNFVPAPYRASTNAKDLIAYAKMISDALNMQLIIGVLSNHRTEAKIRLYSRIFGAPAGAFFHYDGRQAGSLH